MQLVLKQYIIYPTYERWKIIEFYTKRIVFFPTYVFFFFFFFLKIEKFVY